MRYLWDWIVAYLIPTPLYWWGRKWLWDPFKYGVNPFKDYPDARDNCPICQEIARLEAAIARLEEE